MPPFSYTLVPISLDSIRLLSLMPNRDETAPLQCQLHEYSLQGPGNCKETHLYEALSYVWGSFDDPPQCILVNGHYLPVTANLHSALLHVRNHTFQRTLWVDAVCINQKDEKEKSLQIQLMTKIYSQADRVIVYLGDAADFSDQALELIRTLAEDESIDITISEEDEESEIMDNSDQISEVMNGGYRLSDVTDDSDQISEVMSGSYRASEVTDNSDQISEVMNDSYQISEVTDNSDLGLRNMGIDAHGEPNNPSISNSGKESVLKLCKRPWFQRIWVLQEVGSARNILIMCGSAEINGFTFCYGISKLNIFYGDHSGLQSLIRPVIYLIRGAIFRPRYTFSSAENLSLGELIDMYHTHKATIRHDKVYALLGMSSDGLNSALLLPDYMVPWKTLLQRLVRMILHEGIYVETWDDREISVIKSRGYVLGHVSAVYIDNNRDHRQYIDVTFNERSKSLQFKRYYGTHWRLQASAQYVREDDMVCLLQWTSKPIIIRACQDHFIVIMSRVAPRWHVKSENESAIPQQALHSSNSYNSLHDFLLIWNWERIPVSLQDHVGYEHLTEINDLLPEYIKIDADKRTRSINVALALGDAESNGVAKAKLMKEIKNSEGVLGTKDLHILSLKDHLAWVYKGQEQWDAAENLFLEVINTRQDLQGRDHQDTLNSKATLATLYIDQAISAIPEFKRIFLKHPLSEISPLDRSSLEKVPKQIRCNTQIKEAGIIIAGRCLDKRMMKLLLSLKEDNVHINKNVVESLANEGRGFYMNREDNEMMMVLLEERGEDMEMTEETLEAIIRAYGKDVIKLLLDKRGTKMEVTNKLLKAAVTRQLLFSESDEVMALLLDNRAANATITEELMIEMVGNMVGNELLKVLLEKQGENIHITEGVLNAVVKNNAGLQVRNPKLEDDIAMLLIEKRGADMQVTEQIVRIISSGLKFGKQVLMLLLEKQGERMEVTEDMVKIVAEKYPEEIHLLERMKSKMCI